MMTRGIQVFLSIGAEKAGHVFEGITQYFRQETDDTCIDTNEQARRRGDGSVDLPGINARHFPHESVPRHRDGHVCSI